MGNGAQAVPKKTDTEKGRAVRVARDIVGTVRRIAAMTDRKVEAVVEPLLRHCVKLVDAELKRDGVAVVSDRAAALTDLTPPDALGPFSVDQELATDLARQAGYCRTSIAKLVDPHLRELVQREYLPAIQEELTRARFKLPREPYRLTVYGKVPAGWPAGAWEDGQTFDFASHFGDPGNDDDTFMLKVKGTSMIDAHITSGDFVVLRRTPEAEAGDIVVAMIDGDLTLKKLKRDVGRDTGEGVLRLYPCNSESNLPPIDFKDVADSIVGVKIGVVRSSKAERDGRRSPRPAPRGSRR